MWAGALRPSTARVAYHRKEAGSVALAGGGLIRHHNWPQEDFEAGGRWALVTAAGGGMFRGIRNKLFQDRFTIVCVTNLLCKE